MSKFSKACPSLVMHGRSVNAKAISLSEAIGSNTHPGADVSTIRLTERQLRDWLFDNSQSFWHGELEDRYGPLIPLATEVPTDAGPIDLLGVTPLGGVVIVETKLCRNPESRRKVVAQAIDYARSLRGWQTVQLSRVLASSHGLAATSPGEDWIVQRVLAAGHEVDPSILRNRLDDTLLRGEFVVLLIGDHVRDCAADLVDYINTAPSLHFTLRAIELRAFRAETSDQAVVFVQSQIVIRTVEVRRIIEAERRSWSSESRPDRAETLDEAPDLLEARFFREIGRETGKKLETLLTSLRDQGVSWTAMPGKQHISLWLWITVENSIRVTAGRIPSPGARLKEGGSFDTNFVRGRARKSGFPEEVATWYLEALAAVVGGIVQGDRVVTQGSPAIGAHIDQYLVHHDAFRAAILGFGTRLRASRPHASR